MRRLIGRWTSPAGLRYAGLLAGLGLVGCGGLEPVATYQPTTDAAKLYTALQLNYHGITLSTNASDPAYNTLQLTATPLNSLGEPMTGLPAPKFTSSDTSRISVTPQGLVTAKRTGNNLKVFVELVSQDNIRQADTAFIRVTATVPASPLASISLDPVPPDSAVVFLIGTPGPTVFVGVFSGFYPFGLQVQATALDALGNPMSGLVYAYSSLDNNTAVVNRTTGEINPIRPGRINFVASATAYGVTKVDTTTYKVTWPAYMDISITDSGFEPKRAIVTKNAIVGWSGGVVGQMDVTFDNPANVASPPVAYCIDAWITMADVVESFFGETMRSDGPYCGTGNIARFSGSDVSVFVFPLLPDGTAAVRQRQFPVPGIYTYHNTVNGTTGTVEVRDDE